MSASHDAVGREGRLCPYCGETDPWPRYLCLTRLTQGRGPNPAPFSCAYSLEGDARTTASLAETGRKIVAIKRRAIAGTDREGGRDD